MNRRIAIRRRNRRRANARNPTIRRNPRRITATRGQRAILPPLRSEFSTNYRLTFRVVWDVGTGGAATRWVVSDSYFAGITEGYIFASPHATYQGVFNAFKVHAITSRWMQAVLSTDKIGFNVMSLIEPEFTTDSTQLNPLIASPGSTLRPDGQVIRCQWRPKEPTEFEWFKNGSAKTHPFAAAMFKTFPSAIESWYNQKSNNNGIYGKIVADIDISLAGMGKSFGSPILCTCKKCQDPELQACLAIQDAYNTTFGGNHLLPYLRETVRANVSPDEYILAHATESSWRNHLIKISIHPNNSNSFYCKAISSLENGPFSGSSLMKPSPSPLTSSFADLTLPETSN